MRIVGWHVMVMVVFSVFLSGWKSAGGDTTLPDPSYYVKKELWSETMLASRAAIRDHEGPADRVLFDSGIMRGGDEPKRVSVDVSNAKQLWLMGMDGGDGVTGDTHVWADATLIAKDGTKTRVGDLEPIWKTGGQRYYRNRNHNSQPLRIGRKAYEHGILTYTRSRWTQRSVVGMCFAVDKKYERFEAWVGPWLGKGTVQFKVVDRLNRALDVWQLIKRDYPAEAEVMVKNAGNKYWAWFDQKDMVEMEKQVFDKVIKQVSLDSKRLLEEEFAALKKNKVSAEDARWLSLCGKAFRCRAYLADAQQVNLKGLRACIEDIIKSFPGQYPQGQEYLRRWDGFEKRLHKLHDELVKGGETLKEQCTKYIEELVAFQRETMRVHPLVVGQPIVFIVRNQYPGSYHAIATMFPTAEHYTKTNEPYNKLFKGPGAMKVIDFATGGKVKTLVDVPEGVARDPDVHFSGKKIVFAMRHHKDEDYHIYEINADGTNLKQLTSAEGVADWDPIYLPDDSIVFSSLREPKYNMCSRDHAANLFRMEADGANIFQITKNTLFDNHSSLLPDGRILYARWEYVDRNFGDAHSVWTVNPDGTNQALYWGNNTPVPPAEYNNHHIPGTQKFISILGPHHYMLTGSLAVIDRRLGIDGREPLVRTWPAGTAERCRADGGFAPDSILGPYEDPWPLSDKYFLCSRITYKGKYMGIFLIDTFGNETLLHTEEPGCFDAMPIKPRKRPPVVPARRDFRNEPGYLYVTNVYEGTHMKGVKPGSVKYLRVVESPEKRHWSRGSWQGQGYTAPGMNWHSLENKRILGTVPVEKDGSAYFEVPTDKFVYFQLLDENGMMIQSMRSGTVVQSGETTGCVGCHEHRLTAPVLMESSMPLALRREPSKLKGWYGPQRDFSYTAEVQPVFDEHCVKCHDYGKKAGKKLNLAGDRGRAFNKSYVELWTKKSSGKGYIKCVGGGPAQIQQAYSWGSHASKIVQMIRAGHNKVKLSKEDFDRVVTWIDLNGVYNPSYACAYPRNTFGRCPLDTHQEKRLQELGAKFGVGDISFDRPEISPCLAKIADKDSLEYKEALAIIKKGQETLKRRPRADMPGFIPCEFDQLREQRYAIRRQLELRNRRAIREGYKVYDDR